MTQKPLGFILMAIAGAILLLAESAPGQNLFVADRFNGDIYEYTPGGVQSTFATGLDDPFGMAFNDAGDLFVDLASGKIIEITPDGSQSTFAQVALNSRGIAINRAGDLFIAGETDTPDTGEVIEITPDGTQSIFASGLSSPDGLAFNSAGDLFVSNLSGVASILEFTPTGVQSTFFASVSTVSSVLAFNGAGNLFVGGQVGGRITEIAPDGTPGTFASGLGNIQGLAFDTTGNLFVSGEAAQKIYEIAPDGTQSTFASVASPFALAFQGETLPVPEPSALGLLAVGAIFFVRRRSPPR